MIHIVVVKPMRTPGEQESRLPVQLPATSPFSYPLNHILPLTCQAQQWELLGRQSVLGFDGIFDMLDLEKTITNEM